MRSSFVGVLLVIGIVMSSAAYAEETEYDLAEARDELDTIMRDYEHLARWDDRLSSARDEFEAEVARRGGGAVGGSMGEALMNAYGQYMCSDNEDDAMHLRQVTGAVCVIGARCEQWLLRFLDDVNPAIAGTMEIYVRGVIDYAKEPTHPLREAYAMLVKEIVGRWPACASSKHYTCEEIAAVAPDAATSCLAAVASAQ